MTAQAVYDGLLRAGARAFPLEPWKKAPPPTGWQTKSTDRVEYVERYLESGRNVGLAIGGRLFVVDLDLKGMARLPEITATPGWSDDTLVVKTPHGCHLYWLTPEGHPVPEQGSSKTLLGEGVDTRVADEHGRPKGFVVGPGSRVTCDKPPEECDGQHPTEYVAITGDYWEPQVAPPSLLGLLERPGQRPLMPPQGDAAPAPGSRDVGADSKRDEWIQRLASAPSGERNDTLHRAVSALYPFAMAGRLDWVAVLRDLELACYQNGVVDQDGMRTVQATIQSAVATAKAGSASTARPRQGNGGNGQRRRQRPPVPQQEGAGGFDGPPRAEPSVAAQEALEQINDYEAGKVCANCNGPRQPLDGVWQGIYVCPTCFDQLTQEDTP